MDSRGLYGPMANNQWAPVPKLPPIFLIEDRDDGTLWLLTHTEDRANIMITTDYLLPRYTTWTRLGPNDGPYLSRGDTWVRLFIRDGSMGWEEAETFHDSNPRILTRRGSATTFNHIYIANDFPRDSVVRWRDWAGED